VYKLLFFVACIFLWIGFMESYGGWGNAFRNTSKSARALRRLNKFKTYNKNNKLLYQSWTKEMRRWIHNFHHKKYMSVAPVELFWHRNTHSNFFVGLVATTNFIAGVLLGKSKCSPSYMDLLLQNSNLTFWSFKKFWKEILGLDNDVLYYAQNLKIKYIIFEATEK
jgi:hypothetical protein